MRGFVPLRFTTSLLLALLLLAHIVANVAWLRADVQPPGWDQAIHLTYSLIYYRLFQTGLLNGLIGASSLSSYYPPFVHLSAIPFYALLGVQPRFLDTPDVAALANLVFLGILLYSTYGIGSRVWGRGAGLLAATLLSFYPLVFVLSREFLLDFALTALTALAVYLLLRTDRFQRRREAVLLGIVCGLALLTKWSFALLFLAPMGYIAVQGLRDRGEGRGGKGKEAEGREWKMENGKPDLQSPISNLQSPTHASRITHHASRTRCRLNVLWTLVCALLVAGLWYLSHPDAIIRELLISNQTAHLDGDPAYFTLGYFLYYPLALVQHQTFLPFALLFLVGLVHTLRTRQGRGGGRGGKGRERERGNSEAEEGCGRDVTVLWLWLLGGLAVCTAVLNKDPRFSLPLLPAVALVSSGWLWHSRGRTVLVPWVILVGLLQYVGVSFGIPWLPQRVAVAGLPVFAQECHLSRHPARTKWPLAELVEEVYRHVPLEAPVRVLPNHGSLNAEVLKYEVVRAHLPELIPAYPDIRPLAQTRTPTWEELASYAALITKTGSQGLEAHARFIEETQRLLARHQADLAVAYPHQRQFAWPDGSTATVYVKPQLVSW